MTLAKAEALCSFLQPEHWLKCLVPPKNVISIHMVLQGVMPLATAKPSICIHCGLENIHRFQFVISTMITDQHYTGSYMPIVIFCRDN